MLVSSSSYFSFSLLSRSISPSYLASSSSRLMRQLIIGNISYLHLFYGNDLLQYWMNGYPNTAFRLEMTCYCTGVNGYPNTAFRCPPDTGLHFENFVQRCRVELFCKKFNMYDMVFWEFFLKSFTCSFNIEHLQLVTRKGIFLFTTTFFFFICDNFFHSEICTHGWGNIFFICHKFLSCPLCLYGDTEIVAVLYFFGGKYGGSFCSGVPRQ